MMRWSSYDQAMRLVSAAVYRATPTEKFTPQEAVSFILNHINSKDTALEAAKKELFSSASNACQPEKLPLFYQKVYAEIERYPHIRNALTNDPNGEWLDNILSHAKVNKIKQVPSFMYSFRNAAGMLFDSYEDEAAMIRYLVIRYCTDVSELSFEFYGDPREGIQGIRINSHYNALFSHDYDAYAIGYFFRAGKGTHPTQFPAPDQDHYSVIEPHERSLTESKYKIFWQLVLLKKSIVIERQRDYCIQYIFFWVLLLDSLGEVHAKPVTSYLTLANGSTLDFPEDCRFSEKEIQLMYNIFLDWSRVDHENSDLYSNQNYQADKKRVQTIFRTTFPTHRSPPSKGLTHNPNTMSKYKFHIRMLKEGVQLLKEGIQLLRDDESKTSLSEINILENTVLLNSIREAAQEHGITQRICMDGSLNVTVDMLSMLAGCNTYPPLVHFIARNSKTEILDRILHERPDFMMWVPRSKQQETANRLAGFKRKREGNDAHIKVRALELLWNHAKATTEDKFNYDEQEDEYRLVTTAETGAGQDEGNTRTGDENEARQIQTYLGRQINVNFHHLIDRNGQLIPKEEGVFDKYNALYGPNRAQTVLQQMLPTPPHPQAEPK